MKNEKFWIVIKDNNEKKFSLLGPANDDTQETKIIATLNHNGENLGIETSDSNKNRDSVMKIFEDAGYSYSENLFESCVNKYEKFQNKYI